MCRVLGDEAGHCGCFIQGLCVGQLRGTRAGLEARKKEFCDYLGKWTEVREYGGQKTIEKLSKSPLQN